MSGNILIISNEALNYELLIGELSRADFSVKHTEWQPTEPGFPGTFKPDLALVDTMLGESNCRRICSEMRKIVPGPIGLYGYQSDEQVWIRSFDTGADFYLTTSWQTAAMIEYLKAVFRRYRWNAQGFGR